MAVGRSSWPPIQKISFLLLASLLPSRGGLNDRPTKIGLRRGVSTSTLHHCLDSYAPSHPVQPTMAVGGDLRRRAKNAPSFLFLRLAGLKIRRLLLVFHSEEIGPLLPSADQSRPNRIFTKVEPFLHQRFVFPKQAIKGAFLPPPFSAGRFLDGSFQARRILRDLCLAIKWAGQGVQMIRHDHQRVGEPMRVRGAKIPGRLKYRGGRQDRPPFCHAQSDEIGNGLLRRKQHGNPGRSGHEKVVAG